MAPSYLLNNLFGIRSLIICETQDLTSTFIQNLLTKKLVLETKNQNHPMPHNLGLQHLLVKELSQFLLTRMPSNICKKKFVLKTTNQEEKNQFQRKNLRKRNRTKNLQKDSIFSQFLIYSYFIIMKTSDIETELKNYKIRQGYLLKRSRVLREWRKRWIVLTFNFLFSFESQECEKVTQAVDLKEVIGFRTHLRKQEQNQPHCFYIQTKAVDFAFSTKEACEKWSWTVTLERLFDFKERGASKYNNIDQIKTEGFDSQHEFEFKQKGSIKNPRKIISTSEPDRQKEARAQQLLKELIERQQKLNQREEQLLQKEKQLDKIQKISSDCSNIMNTLSNRIKDLECQIGQIGLRKLESNKKFGERKEELRRQKTTSGKMQIQKSFSGQGMDSFTKNKSSKRVIQQSQIDRRSVEKIQSGKQSIIVNRYKCIQYLFDQFQNSQNSPELVQIVLFIMKVSVIPKNIFRQGIHTCISLHKNIQNFIKELLTVIKNLPINLKNTQEGINIMALTLQDQNSISISQLKIAEKIVLNYCNSFSKQTSIDLVQKSISLLLMILEKTKGVRNPEIQNTVTKLSELSEEAEYKRQCELILKEGRKSPQKSNKSIRE